MLIREFQLVSVRPFCRERKLERDSHAFLQNHCPDARGSADDVWIPRSHENDPGFTPGARSFPYLGKGRLTTGVSPRDSPFESLCLGVYVVNRPFPLQESLCQAPGVVTFPLTPTKHAKYKFAAAGYLPIEFANLKVR